MTKTPQLQTNHTPQTNSQYMYRKESAQGIGIHPTAITRENNSETLSLFLSLSEIIAKLESKLTSTTLSKHQSQNPTNDGSKKK